MTLGEKIKQLRSEKNLSQAALEKISGVNSKLLSKYENERIVPTADSLKKLAEALQISADYLIFDNAPKSGLSQLADLDLFEKFQEGGEVFIFQLAEELEKDKVEEEQNSSGEEKTIDAMR